MHNHLQCLRDDHLAVQVVSPTKLQVGAAPAGPTIVFTPTAGAAQAQQIDAKAQGAEVIGTALLYPNQGSDSRADAHRGLSAQGVQGVARDFPRRAESRLECPATPAPGARAYVCICRCRA